MSSLLIVGAGGHGRVVADAASAMGSWRRVAFLDDRFPNLKQVDDWAVLDVCSGASRLRNGFSDLCVAIGDNRRRVELLRGYADLGFRLAVVRHPAAFVSGLAEVGPGSVVFAQAAINIGARLGTGCIVNTGATIDHDCILEDGVHVSPGAHLGGDVRVGLYSWIGVGASVRHQASIGASVTVGAGGAVVDDVTDGSTVIGVPAREQIQ